MSFFIRTFMTLLMITTLSSCSYLLTPSVEPVITQLEQGQYKLDPEHTTVLFKVQHLGLSTYVGRFNEMSASLNFEPNKMAQSTLQAKVQSNSVDVNNESLEDTLRGSSWFNAEQFPEVVLKTLSVTPTEKENEFQFNAELTLLGVTKPVTLNATFHGGANNMLTGFYTLGFSATGSIKRSDFGMDQYIPMVGDKVDVEIYAEFQKVED